MKEPSEIASEVASALSERIVESREEHGWHLAYVSPEDWFDSCALVRDKLGLDYLASITAVDLSETLELVAHLCSSDGQHKLALKSRLNPKAPRVRSVIEHWTAANWLEREVHEMFGIEFEGHPDLSLLLLPDDWEGYPLRKDYVEPD